MRCPTCQARNTDTADWCSQCYAPLKTEPEPPPPDREPAEGVHPPPAAGATAGAGTEATTLAGGGRFRRTDDGLDWRCDVCDGWNPIEITTCTVCGAPFAEALAPTSGGPQREVSESTVTVSSAAVPGLGHILLGRTVTGWSRLVTWALWFIGGLWLLLEAQSVGGSVLPAIPLLLGTVVIWVASPIDALAAHRGSTDELLRPRVFLWLVVAVTGTLMLAFLAAATSLPGALG